MQLLRLPLDNVTMCQAVDMICDRIDGARPTQVSFVNADCVNITYRDPLYLEVLQKSDLNFIDGVGMNIAGRWLGQPVVENVNGTDMLPDLCAKLAQRKARIFLLGARPGVAAKVGEWMTASYPNLQVAGIEHGYFSAADEANVLKRIAETRPDVLLVAMGAPHQEKWIQKHLHEFNAKVAIGVGGLFDFYSGRIPRAPIWMRRIGFEWTWRLYQEPRRLFWRYLFGNPLFLLRLVRERLVMSYFSVPAVITPETKS